MDFSPQRYPTRNAAGIGAVLALHALVGYALMNGLGHKVVEVLKKPLEVSLVEEVKPLPPPPPKALPPPPKAALPPPAYVPPPEIQVQAPPPPNAIAATTSTPAPPVEVAPPPPAPAKAAPQSVAVGVACPNHLEVRSRVAFPAQAQRLGLSGDVLVEFTVNGDGNIGNITVVRSSHPVFNDTATQAVAQFRCNGQGQDVRVRVPFVFRLER